MTRDQLLGVWIQGQGNCLGFSGIQDLGLVSLEEGEPDSAIRAGEKELKLKVAGPGDGPWN